MLGLEPRVLAHRIGGDAVHRNTLRMEPRTEVSELTRFDGAARGVVLGVEIQHHALAAEICKRYRRAGVVREGEGRRAVPRADVRVRVHTVCLPGESAPRLGLRKNGEGLGRSLGRREAELRFQPRVVEHRTPAQEAQLLRPVATDAERATNGQCAREK